MSTARWRSVQIAPPLLGKQAGPIRGAGFFISVVRPCRILGSMAYYEGYQAIEALQAATEAAGWECEYRQLEAGQLEARTVFKPINSSSLICETANRRLDLSARTPDRAITIMVPLAATRVLINGRKLTGDRIIALDSNIDLHASTNSGAEVWSIHLPVNMLRDRACVDGLATTVLEGQPAMLQAFREAIVCSLNVKSQQGLQNCASRFFDLADQLLSRESAHADLDYYHRRQKRRALARAVEFIEENIAGATRIGAVCQYAGVSRRTLERLFRREFQQTPSDYVRARRLNAVRHELWRGLEGDETISDVAARYGFVHMGHFSSAYRRQFGVLPSEDRPAVQS